MRNVECDTKEKFTLKTPNLKFRLSDICHLSCYRLAAIFAGILIVCFLIASGCTKKENNVQEDSSADSFEIREGKRIYNKYCMPCHGTEGIGDGIYFTTNLQPKPPDFTNEQFMNSKTDKQLFDAISKSPVGAENKGICPPWEFTFVKEEIDLLITYIKKFKEISQ